MSRNYEPPNTGQPGQRWVETRAIQPAAKGRETEVLDALGIPWREGRPHSLPVSVARGWRPVLALGRAEGARPLQLQQRRQHPRRGDEG